jgi:hypothetical protein
MTWEDPQRTLNLALPLKEDQMKYSDVLQDRVVRHAEQIGFMGFGENPAKRKHFHWFMPDADIHGDHTFAVNKFGYAQPMIYTVNHQSTTYQPRAIEWLDASVEGVREGGR